MSEIQSSASAAPAPSTGSSQVVTDNSPAAPIESTGTPSEWTTGFNDDLRGFVQNKGFKGPVDVVEGYRNFEKLMGVPKDRLLTVPKDETDQEGWGQIYNKLGRPPTPNEYKLEMPEGADPGFSKWAAERFHELGFSKSQGEKLTQKWNSYMSEASQKAQAEYNTKLDQEVKGLEKEWGAAYQQNLNIAGRTKRSLGISDEMVDQLEMTMGHGKLMKWMHEIGSKLGEDSYVKGEGAGNMIYTPEQARNQIQALQGDPDFVNRYLGGDLKAKEEMAKLHKMANPGS